MIVQIDTREHKAERERIEEQFRAAGQTDIIHSKLYVGDYCRLDYGLLCIDRKKDLLEVCQNVTQQHERFRNELIRAKDAGIKLIILVEHGEHIERLSDVYFWHNPRLDEWTWVTRNGRPCRERKNPKATDGPQLYRCMNTIEQMYGVTFMFCDKRETGFKILKILGGKDGKLGMDQNL